MDRFQAQWPPDDQTYLNSLLAIVKTENPYAILPFSITLLSVGMLTARTVSYYALKTRETEAENIGDASEPGDPTSNSIVARNGGAVIFTFMVARVLDCAALVGFSLLTVLRTTSTTRHLSNELYDVPVCMLLSNVYALFLASIAITCQHWRKWLIRHNIVVLLTELGVYTYKNVWPLATYTKEPADLAEGWLMWTKLGTLTFAAIIIPLFIPTEYIPVDPKRPEKEPHPEQTASLASLRTFIYLSPVVDAARKVAHLPASELPPLADYDRAQDLMKHAEPYLSPTKVRKGGHIFFGLLRCFSMSYFKAWIALVAWPASGFLSTLAINRLLTALESHGKNEVEVRPWFWILVLLVAPLLGTVSFQYYILAMSHALATSESILTQLIFDYSLRVRVKAESSEKSATGDASAAGEGSEGDQKAKKATSSFIGRLTNLVTIDLGHITDARDLLFLFWDTPLEILGGTVFLYLILGWSAFVGLGLTIALLPVPGWLATVASRVQDEKMKKTDDRTQTVTESMNVLRMVKMFGWEKKIQGRIDERRETELKWVWKARLIDVVMLLVGQIIPTFTMLVTYATATLVAKVELTAARVFSSMILFDNIRGVMTAFNYDISAFIQGKVSIDRMNDFFKQTELLDGYSEEDSPTTVQPAVTDEKFLGFRNATFTWNPESSKTGTDTPSSQFKLTIPGELQFVKGKINLILGSTGSGKTSLLMALLGEMHFSQTHPDSSFNLPRTGGVSFAVQESWVLNQTIRDNILFGSPYEEERYQKVLHQCALEEDLELFDAGDQTEVGERGLTLSGGQKARLTLARAIYSRAEIVLLDDVFAALDVHTAKWIVNKCFKGDLIEGRTVLLVTHNIALTSSLANLIVSVSSTGVATSRGQDLSAAIASEPALQTELKQDEDALAADEAVIDSPPDKKVEKKKADGRLILAEEIQEGNVGWKSIAFFLKAIGGNHATLFFTLWMGGSVLEYVLRNFNLWFLGYWSSQYERHPVEDIPVLGYLGVYALLTLVVLAVLIARNIWILLGQVRASRTIHKVLSESILGTPLRWLDETPVSRIIQRMTTDIGTIDESLVQMLGYLQSTSLSMIIGLISAVIFVPLFTLPGLFIAAIGTYVGSKYLKAQLSIRREMSNAKAPVLAHFSSAASGLVTLRAYGAQDAYRAELQKRLDHYVKIARMSYDLNRWINIRIDALGALFTASLAAYLTYGGTVSAADIGFSLNRASHFCSMLLYVVRIYNQFQVQSNSLERIFAYTEVEQEPKPTEQGKPPAAWPTSGDIKVENLSARYSKTGPTVLHGLTFNIHAGERVGVVGRTGSGKSSLTLALLRCIFTEGSVYYDGVRTSDINLDALRSNITIIPQVPELLSGTLRYNLDPFDEYDDATLNAALKSSGLYATQSDTDEGRLSLDSDISSGGTNVSVGQRQIVALARAIIRSSKLLILDEATSAIDHQTDAVIQNTLRKELGSDVTVLTIAHRLQTIIDADKILVLDAGNIVEFASPSELLEKPKGVFKALVDESEGKEDLYEIAGKRET